MEADACLWLAELAQLTFCKILSQFLISQELDAWLITKTMLTY